MRHFLLPLALLGYFGVGVAGGSSSSLSSSSPASSASFVYSAGRLGKAGKQLSISGGNGGSQIQPMGSLATANSFQTAFVEPRGDGGGGGYGGSGGGWGGGGGGGGVGGVYHYAIQPHGGGGGGGGGWGPPPMYYTEDEGGLDKGLLGLLGLGGLGGLKGLLGLAALLKLLLPLLLLLVPLLLPLLLAKAALLFSLLLLIPIPVITPGRSINGKEGEVTGKAMLQDTLGDLMSRIPTDLNHIIGKIKDSEWFRGAFSQGSSGSGLTSTSTGVNSSKKDKIKSMRASKDLIRSELGSNSISPQNTVTPTVDLNSKPSESS